MNHYLSSDESIASNTPVNHHREDFTYNQFVMWLKNTRTTQHQLRRSVPDLSRLTYAQFYTWLTIDRRNRQQPPPPPTNILDNVDPLEWDFCPCCHIRGLSSSMYHCEECEESFHPTCASVFPPKDTTDSRFKSFVCSLCYWTKRATREE